MRNTVCSQQAEGQPCRPSPMFTKHTGTAAWGHGNGVEDFTKLSLPIGDELTELREVGAMIWWALLCHEVGMTGRHHFVLWPQVPLLCHGRAGHIRSPNGVAQGDRINTPLFLLEVTLVSDPLPPSLRHAGKALYLWAAFQISDSPFSMKRKMIVARCGGVHL